MHPEHYRRTTSPFDLPNTTYRSYDDRNESGITPMSHLRLRWNQEPRLGPSMLEVFRQVTQIALMDNRRANCMLIISTTLTRRTMIYCLRSWCSRSSFTRVSVFRRVIRLSGLRFLWFLAIRVSAVFSFLFVSVSSCLFSYNC